MVGLLRLYSPRAKEIIRARLESFLAGYGAESYSDNLLTCVDELLKNGVKANYKYALIREEIEKFLAENPSAPNIQQILSDRELYAKYVENYVDLPKIVARVRSAITQEAKLINMKMKAQNEKRSYTAEERQKMADASDLRYVRRLVLAYKANVHLRMKVFWGALNIEITNNAPIMNTDLERITSKRLEFKDFADRGEEAIFFINHMDDSDGGAGLGYATIDASLREMGFDPFEVVSLISLTNTTIVLRVKLTKK